MFQKTSPQLSLFSPSMIFPGILPENDWSYIFREKIYPKIDETKFKHLYCEYWGAPNKSIKLQVSLLIFMNMERLTWREAEYHFQRRLDWMNATQTACDMNSIDHTTLYKFYNRIAEDDVAYALFKELTAMFILECNVSTRQQRVDSFFMHGWLAKLSRYGLFKETNRGFLQNLRKQKPGLYDNIHEDLSRDYLKDNFDLTEKDKEKASRKIQEMAEDMYYIKSAFENHSQVKHYKSFQILVQVFDQQCSIVEVDKKQVNSDNFVEIEIKEKPDGKGKQIISTPHNTDAQYTRKRAQTVTGHKGFLTETCDPDNDVQYLTDVSLEAAGHSDAVEIDQIEDRLDENGFKPDVFYGDAGFVNGKSILEAAEKGIKLEGPSAGRSQSIEGFAKEDRPLDVADFKVKIEDDTKELIIISCPSNESPLDQARSEKTNQLLVHFDNGKCKECLLNDRCPVKIGARVSTLTVGEAQYAGAERHQKYMGNSEYRKKCGIRAGAESLVNEVANKHGARKSRHRTEKRSRLQIIFAALACNVKRYLEKTMDDCAQNQLDMKGIVS
ncbi:MAG: transposase [Desulfobacula sp.]|jgi:hypothetical protein|nr:transposase [Desulfobacula sp.]